jgi:hypothetical protein
VATSILSLSTPGTWFGSVEDGRKMSRIVNEFAAQMGRDHPGRFGFFASVPLPDTEGSLKEIDYAFGTLKADGVAIVTSYDTIPVGDKSFWPVFEELNRRKATIFMHRTAATCCLNLRQDPANQEFIVDDLRALNSLLTSGTLARFPDLRLIHSHGDKVMAWVAKLNGAPIKWPRPSRQAILGSSRRSGAASAGVRGFSRKQQVLDGRAESVGHARQSSHVRHRRSVGKCSQQPESFAHQHGTEPDGDRCRGA